jgi:hypothetical protein
LTSGHTSTRNESTVGCGLALRPERLPRPGCHRRRDPRHEVRGGSHRFDCGAGAVLPRA